MKREMCPRCNGTGRLQVDEPECNGGITSTFCVPCNGTGRILPKTTAKLVYPYNGEV